MFSLADVTGSPAMFIFRLGRSEDEYGGGAEFWARRELEAEVVAFVACDAALDALLPMVV